MTAIAVNLDWMFEDEADSTADRIRAASRSGIKLVEMWGWRAKDLDEIKSALAETGVELLTLIVDPQLQLTDPRTRGAFVIAVRESGAAAAQLSAPFLVVVAGDERIGVERSEQRAALVSALREGATQLDGTGITLILENLNDRVDHPGTFLSSTNETLSVVREVGSPHLRMLLDAYHSAVMEEDLAALSADDVMLISHVQVADAPGRHEPGTGSVAWQKVIDVLRHRGYEGAFGMEYVPLVGTAESLGAIRAVIDEADGIVTEV
ncbi:TIM barrel protein [Sinomonas sp. G460-2]|uniref:TIM barrel protein n=1 Tax=Sinomonas sp. G460-2 TaxID=3393464 RepID=UPI0039EF0BF2